MKISTISPDYKNMTITKRKKYVHTSGERSLGRNFLRGSDRIWTTFQTKMWRKCIRVHSRAMRSNCQIPCGSSSPKCDFNTVFHRWIPWLLSCAQKCFFAAPKHRNGEGSIQCDSLGIQMLHQCRSTQFGIVRVSDALCTLLIADFSHTLARQARRLALLGLIFRLATYGALRRAVHRSKLTSGTVFTITQSSTTIALAKLSARACRTLRFSLE